MLAYHITFILAFASIVYELVLGQALTAFLGNTVLRYSVTIGLYMLSMGIGSFLAEAKAMKNPMRTLFGVEVMLTMIGSLSVFILHFIHVFNQGAVLSLTAHLLIVIIGILSGFEIPLLIFINQDRWGLSTEKTLGIDYLGALAGPMLFAFWFYPEVGIMATALTVAFLNGLIGIEIFFLNRLRSAKTESAISTPLGIFHLVQCVIIFFLLLYQKDINDYLSMTFIKSAVK